MHILLPLALPVEYTYRVPRELEAEVAVGKRAIVQFGRKRIYSGLILEISDRPPKSYEAKYLLTILDDRPVITETQFRFWRWIADYYMCSMGEVMNAALPAAMKLESQSKVALSEMALNWNANREQLIETGIDILEVAILDVLATGIDLTIDQVGEVTGKANPYKYIKSLYDRGFIEIFEDIREKYSAKRLRMVRISAHILEKNLLDEVFDSLEKKAPRQLNALMVLVSEKKEKVGMESALLAKVSGSGSGTIRSLIDKGILEEFFVEVDRIVIDYPDELRKNELNQDQELALAAVHEGLNEKKVVLLHGQTSSGKTHIYIRLMEEALEQGRQVLYLLPEISLTTQLIRRVRAYFGDKVMVSHSKFTMNERMEIWNKLVNKEIQMVMAPRSGVFMPFADLGLIIVDEEHETSYKQAEPSPRYHARDAAVVLAQMWNAGIVLGSATPSIESYYNAEKGKYHLVQLEGRFSGSDAPAFETIDMRRARKQKEVTGLFSLTLKERIRNVLDEKEQVILFLNRKGYVPVSECDACGWSPKCVQCDITLTYYKYDNKLRCHYCGYSRDPVNQCPACGNTSITMKGYGTERVEDEVKLLFPEAVVQRFDANTTRKKSAFEAIIKRFENREVDVLIGTQMITKGLDFEHVKLVGVMDADHALNIPDFRAHERAFQLITQVGGRAGRREEQGQALIQTFQPEHAIVRYAMDGDYLSMYHREIMERENFRYPPFNRLIHIQVRDRSYMVAAKAADNLVYRLKPLFGDRLLGPQQPHVSKIRGMYLQSILIKLPVGKSLSVVKGQIRTKIDQVKSDKEFRRTRIIADVDPY